MDNNSGINRPTGEEPDELESLGVNRVCKELESSSLIQSFRMYLNFADPAMFMIHALVLFFMSLILAFLAAKSFGTDLTNQSGTLFFGTLSTLVRVSSAMLVAWAVGRLIADAIKDGAKNE